MAAYRKVFTNSTSDRGLISKICEELKKLDINKPNNPILKWDTGLDREFSTEESQVSEEHLGSTSLAIRKKQIKMTLRFHLTPVRMAKINNTRDQSRVLLLHCFWS